MKVRKITIVTSILLLGATNFLFGDASEDAIAKALSGINTITVMKSAEPKIVSESEPMVLRSDRVKVTKKSKSKRKIKRKVRRYRRTQPVVSDVAMEDLPMAKSYPMSYDVSQITE